MRKIGEVLLARTGYAAFAALLFTLLPVIGLPIGFLATIIVGFVTLCRGPRPGLFVLAWVALPALALLYLHRFSILDSIFLDSIVMWLLAYVLRRLGSWQRVFEIAAVLGVLVVIGVHFAFPTITAWWVENLTKYLANLHTVVSWRLTTEEVNFLVKQFAPMATGTMVLVALFWVWLTLMLARAWQTALYYPGRLRDELTVVRSRIPVAIIVLLGLVGVVLKQPMITDIFPVLLFPIMMSGLSFLHYVAMIKKGMLILLVFIYFSFLLIPFVVVMLLAVIGFLDIWFNFRSFFKIKRGVA